METSIYFVTQHEDRKNTRSPDFLQTRRINNLFSHCSKYHTGRDCSQKKREGMQHVLIQILVAGLRHETVVTDDPSVLSVLEIKKISF